MSCVLRWWTCWWGTLEIPRVRPGWVARVSTWPLSAWVDSMSLAFERRNGRRWDLNGWIGWEWLGMVGNSHKIWLYQLYLVIKVWLNNFLLLNVLGRFRMVTYLKPFKGISISMAMRWAPGISGTSWTCWMIPGVEMTLETLERWHHMPPSPSSVDMGWLMTTTPQLKKRDSYHHFLTRWFLVAIFLYIWMLGLFAPLA